VAQELALDLVLELVHRTPTGPKEQPTKANTILSFFNFILNFLQKSSVQLKIPLENKLLKKSQIH
jgi:hypothetical protein